MALPQVFEGTWEEIKLRDKELAGQFLRVIVNPDLKNIPIDVQDVSKIAAQQGKRKLHGFGMFAHVPGGSEEFAREKQAEIEREDRPRS